MQGPTGELAGLLRRSVMEGDAAAMQRHHQKGKLARERIESLVDEDSIHEIGPFRRHRAAGWHCSMPIAVIEECSPSVRETALSAAAYDGAKRRGNSWLVVGDD